MYLEPLFWAVIVLVAFQYKQVENRQLNLFGAYSCPYWLQTAWAVFYGALGGFVGSLLAMVVGVSLNKLGIHYIWPLALGLMFINMRFICFAYAGGLVALANVLFGWPDVSVSQVLGLVAVLHLTESFLIAISEKHLAAPLYLQQENGQVVGAYSLQVFWPLPLVLLVAMKATGTAVTGVNMPDWWPLIPFAPGVTSVNEWMYMMLPVVAALGYSDIAISSMPDQRRFASAANLAVYSVLLLGLAILSVHFTWVGIIAALAAPLGHELVIYIGERREQKRLPIHIHPASGGVRILGTVYGSPAYESELEPGDVIIGLGGTKIENPEDLGIALQSVGQSAYISVLRNREKMKLHIDFYEEHRLGVILAPTGEELYVSKLASGRLWAWEWIRERLRR